MRHPTPLPVELRADTLTPELLRSAGLEAGRLYRRDISRVSRGIGLWAPGDEDLDPRRRALALATAIDDACLSHTSAALVLGIDLPWEVRDDPRVHLTHPAGTTRRLRRPEVVGHRSRLHQQEITTIERVRSTTPARLWFDLAPPCSVVSLVMLGDHLVRLPRPTLEARHHPYASREELAAVVARAGRVKGKRKAQQALELIRVGSDSFQETALRLALIGAGLPWPSLQVPADPGNPWSPCADLGYPEPRLAIQYDGATHFTPDQARRDQSRDNAFISADWALLCFNADDARDGFRRAAQQVRRALYRRIGS